MHIGVLILVCEELGDLHERPKDETTHGSTRMEEPSQGLFLPIYIYWMKKEEGIVRLKRVSWRKFTTSLARDGQRHCIFFDRS